MIFFKNKGKKSSDKLPNLSPMELFLHHLSEMQRGIGELEKTLYSGEDGDKFTSYKFLMDQYFSRLDEYRVGMASIFPSSKSILFDRKYAALRAKYDWFLSITN